MSSNPLPFSLCQKIRSATRGEFRADELTRALYSTDASIYRIAPRAVFYPRDAQDVAALIDVLKETDIQIIGRGGGSGLAGESLGPAVIVDFSRHMNRILSLDLDAGRVRVQPGLILDELNRFLALHGKKYAPDPASYRQCAIGGMVATNAAGARSLVFGTTRDHIAALDLLTVEGIRIEARPLPRDGADLQAMLDSPGAGPILRELIRILDAKRELIETKTPRRLARHAAGYLLHDVLTAESFDLCKLICGSEGTLALTLEAELPLAELPPAAVLGMFSFSSVLAAAESVASILEHNPSACELLDSFVLNLSREAPFGYDKLLPEDAQAVLLVEFYGETRGEAKEKLERLAADLLAPRGPATAWRAAIDPQEQEKIWAIRRTGEPLLHRRPGKAHPIGFLEGSSVPPERLPEYIRGVEKFFAARGIEWATYAHAGPGVLHTRPYLDTRDPKHLQIMKEAADAIADLVLSLGGSITGEHGDGLARSHLLRKQYGELYPVFGQIKALFDPRGRLNPGKIVVEEGSNALVENLRYPPGFEARERETALVWQEEEMAFEVERCNGCGLCRTPGEALVMCPIFKDVLEEEASPRAHANLMRYLSSGDLDAAFLGDDEFKRMADHCVNCKSCQIQCPLTVNIPKLMLEARTEYVRRRGQSPANYPFVFAEGASRLATLAAPLANWSLKFAPLRRLIERMIGLDVRRQMPKFASRPFLRRAQPVRPANELAKIVYFADLYANYNEPLLARQFAEIMRRNGVRVEFPAGQVGSALPAMDYGSAEIARKAIRRNANVFSPWIDKGYAVVATEPSAALAIKEEALSFLDEPLVKKLADNTTDAMSFLRDLLEAGKLKTDFQPVPMTLGYHMPCHMRALRAGNPSLEILRLIPGLKIESLGEGCCGIAGTWGMKAENFDRSMRVGERLFERLHAEDIEAGITECSTCKMQMEQGVAKPTLHPLSVLAKAYGIAVE